MNAAPCGPRRVVRRPGAAASRRCFR
ncbi:hypothetical protein FHS29_003538 [Saccharothrix tamanrassetensis]|uniref:Uncharacterized protein n=1 Tax=Saccharothrix tamanrassetensis TaxID=1051531 RepID=A0A841CLR5_9PSEU|nr:hypothetical protein [Saccharothrix tamanrassetensis]